MVAYEFYVYDEMKELHSIGILPERRKSPLRITQDSIMKWGKMVVGDRVDVNNICFVRVEMVGLNLSINIQMSKTRGRVRKIKGF